MIIIVGQLLQKKINLSISLAFLSHLDTAVILASHMSIEEKGEDQL